MKKHYILIITAIIIAISGQSFAQLANSNMTLLANKNQHFSSSGTYSAIWGYKAPNGREYAILGCYGGTAFVDVTDSANIVESDFLPGLSSNWREMKTYSHYAYIVSEAVNSKLQIVDLQYLPDSVHLVSTYSYSGYTKTHTIQQMGPFLYLNGGNVTLGGTNQGGLTILDLTVNPEAPVKRGSWSTRYVHDCRVKNDTIYACNINNGQVTVINAANKDTLITINQWLNNPNPSPHNCELSADSKYCFVTDEVGSAPRELKVWNIQDLSNVVQVATWQPTGLTNTIVHNIEIYGKYAIIAHYEAGIRIVDISNPLAPAEVAWYDTYLSQNALDYKGCWGVYMFPSGKIIASDLQTGLYVVKPTITLTGIEGVNNTTPDKYELSQNYPNPFNPSTKINFSLSKNSVVSLKVINLAGQVVANVINDRRDAGSYEITFDAAKYGLSSGAYFYQLKTDGFSETKKMLLIK